MYLLHITLHWDKGQTCYETISKINMESWQRCTYRVSVAGQQRYEENCKQKYRSYIYNCHKNRKKYSELFLNHMKIITRGYKNTKITLLSIPVKTLQKIILTFYLFWVNPLTFLVVVFFYMFTCVFVSYIIPFQLFLHLTFPFHLVIFVFLRSSFTWFALFTLDHPLYLFSLSVATKLFIL